MEFETWMLLIFPLFFGMGWLAARLDIKELLSESSALPQSYFQGLNFLLNEQQDKAIEAFIEVVKIDPQTVELHFALGSLFRRRGEVDRALRMHHNLVDRTDLDENKRQQAIFELAQDYLKAGILDRAESLFQELKNTSYAKASLEFLLELFQKEHDWPKAIETVHRLAEVSGQSYGKQAAFFYCELANEKIAGGDPDAARIHLQQALATFPNSVRATMMLGDMAASKGEHQEAINIWKNIETQDSQYLPLVAESMLNAFRGLNRESEGIALLREYLGKYHSLDLMNVVFDGVLKNEGSSAAYLLVRDEMQRNPTLLGLDKLLEAQLLEMPLYKRADVELVKNLVHKRTRNLAMYHCAHCGFKARQFYWHCPACHAWDSYPPRRSEETGTQV
ncbi:MAG: lipopolysaccharide assembly protein LapB [Gallionellales bacterium RIFCSPLOWO2_12_FULL_57_18]|nr:MAG: lipopolysaccharide assembly protein LapB [Gallionellales bacterium RIFCSPLOWO2_12_FULL_57_18]OGS96939.1 MAG: lipopolysaccharide assembly protein LapB [Gallionellales bacterium RIFCSPLOWO2_02_FULL_57_47]OGT10273.1 MAG: lipopolysaccharide assembly protein LapB [Gallionellales bacterium RIFCSPHIGHO2_02_FULL_57_16]